MKKMFSLSTSKVWWILVGLGAILYSNTLGSPFQCDDFQAIADNRIIRSLNLPALWHAFNTRFIVGLSLALNYALGQDNVMGYHLFNTLIHILNAFLVYKLICLTFKTPRMSSPNALVGDHRLLGFLTALIFLVHPIQTQAVTYIWQRATSLATFFYLGSLVFYVRGRLNAGSSPLSPISYLLCLLFTVLGMFTKEIVFTLPFAIALYELIFLKGLSSPNVLVGDQVQHDSRLKPAGMTVVVWVLLGLSLLIIPWTMTQANEKTLPIIRPINTRIHHENPLDNVFQMTRTIAPELISRHDFILTEMNVLRTYLRLFILPIHQSVDYDYPRARSLLEPNTLLSLLLLLSLLGSGFLLLKKHPLLSFGIFWFFLTLSVESLVAQEEFIFEHRMYLPIVGLSLFLVAGLSSFLKNTKRLTWVILLIAACFSFMTYQRNFVWRDEFTLWNDAVKKAPGKARAYNGRGSIYKKAGALDKALLDFSRAIQIYPDYADAYANRGAVYEKQGLWDLALADCNRAITLDPTASEAYSDRGSVYSNLGLVDQALLDFDRAIKINPDNATFYSNRAAIYEKKGLIDKALLDCVRAIELKPELPEPYNNRGVIYEKTGLLDKAYLDYTRSIQLKPGFASAYSNRASVLIKMGRLKEVLSDCDRVIELDPNSEQARSNRLVVLEMLKRAGSNSKS